MDITSAFAAQTYAKARPATAPLPGEAGSSNSFGQLAGNFADTLASSLAVETAVTVRDKVVEAYQEILRMPV
jgi:flagellar hook-basal body complex protein FliE